MSKLKTIFQFLKIVFTLYFAQLIWRILEILKTMTKLETLLQLLKIAFALYFAWLAWRVLEILKACDL